MKYKKIIDDQVRYIYNVVIIPRVEYKMLITILSREDINTLTAKIRRLMRNKMGISNTAPNIILTHKDLYNLIDLFYRQGEAQITNLLKRLNNSHLVGEITQIKSNDGKKLLEWRQIPSKNAITLKGKIPQWFKKLEMEVMENESRTLKNEFNIQNNKIKTRNQRILLSTKIDYRKNNWVAGIKNKNDNNIYIGMLFTKKPNIYTESMIEI